MAITSLLLFSDRTISLPSSRLTKTEKKLLEFRYKSLIFSLDKGLNKSIDDAFRNENELPETLEELQAQKHKKKNRANINEKQRFIFFMLGN
jgi:succinate dehydrogenase/fumarate reductase flavoprotein subunit